MSETTAVLGLFLNGTLSPDCVSVSMFLYEVIELTCDGPVVRSDKTESPNLSTLNIQIIIVQNSLSLSCCCMWGRSAVQWLQISQPSSRPCTRSLPTIRKYKIPTHLIDVHNSLVSNFIRICWTYICETDKYLNSLQRKAQIRNFSNLFNTWIGEIVFQDDFAGSE